MGAIDSTAFFKVVDDVLVEAKRSPLKAGGPEAQVISVLPSDRVLQILAGPGSGKTEMLVWRILFELFVLQTPAHQIMATTFTRRAATELELRLVERSDAFLRTAKARGFNLPDPKVQDLRIGTIHSLCDALLAEFDTDYLRSGTQIIDDVETNIRLAREGQFSLGFSNRPPKRVLNRLFENPALTTLFRAPWEMDGVWPSNMMERMICTHAMLNQHVETWVPRCAASDKKNGIELVHGPVGVTDDLKKIHRRWREYQAKHNILDFGTIQEVFLERQAMIAPHLSHVFVDEFQDSNPIQYEIHTRWLKHKGIRLTVVGDDDQAIYRFRGSDIACFNSLGPFCEASKLPYRIGKLEVNYRSTERIIRFCKDYRSVTALGKLSMPKNVSPPNHADKGNPVRLLQGDWDKLCESVASELKQMGAGLPPIPGGERRPSAAILMFSTSERSNKDNVAPARAMRAALEGGGLRVCNPRNKMAGAPGTPVADLLGLISYLIDPISMAPAGKTRRLVMVSASMQDGNEAHAKTNPPPFSINKKHLEFQKKFFKGDGGGIGAPSPTHKPIVDLLDGIRSELVRFGKNGDDTRLTLAGLVSRLLSLPYFRKSGFTTNMFRQALFTKLLEANIAPTRLTMKPLDSPLSVKIEGGKPTWDDRFWSLLNIFGAYVFETRLDDPEVETFEENAVMLLTFHQAKGLEFDHVYVAGTGRSLDLGPALRTKLFSGEVPKYSYNGELKTPDREVKLLAQADCDREVYVAITRAKKALTVLHQEAHGAPLMDLSKGIETIFASLPKKKHPKNAKLVSREFL